MLEDVKQLKEVLSVMVKNIVADETKNVLRVERYDVTMAPANGKIGVKQPFGSTELMLPYSAQGATAQVGDTVLVLWRGTLSTAKVWCFADGPV